MNRFSFNTFVVHDENRQACEMCAAIADLKSVKPLPLVVVGDSGSGKTHLLCAIVNHVREQSPRTALAYVTAKDFPQDVRALVERPGPVKGAPAAVLLVDQLEKFDLGLLEIIEKIAPLFTGENRYLVFASKTHPTQDANLPDFLRKLLKSGRIATVKRRAAQEQAPRIQAQIQSLQSELDVARNEIRRLSDLAAELGPVQGRLLKAEAELQRVERERFRLEDAVAGRSVLEQEVRSLQSALEEMRKQRDACQVDGSVLAASTAEIERLRQQLSLLPPAKEEDAPAAKMQALETDLQQARQAAQEAQSDLDCWALRAQAILQQVELNRIKLAENEEMQLQQVLGLQQKVSELTANETPKEITPVEQTVSTADGEAIATRLTEITKLAHQAAEKGVEAEADPESRVQALYAQLLLAASAIQDLSDGLNAPSDIDTPGAPRAATTVRPWYAQPFPLPQSNQPGDSPL